jgi:hypothetical protein
MRHLDGCLPMTRITALRQNDPPTTIREIVAASR